MESSLQHLRDNLQFSFSEISKTCLLVFPNMANNYRLSVFQYRYDYIHERKVLFQLFGSNYLFLLIQNTFFDMIIIYSMLLSV